MREIIRSALRSLVTSIQLVSSRSSALKNLFVFPLTNCAYGWVVGWLGGWFVFDKLVTSTTRGRQRRIVNYTMLARELYNARLNRRQYAIWTYKPCAQSWPDSERRRQGSVHIGSAVPVHAVLAPLNYVVWVLRLVLASAVLNGLNRHVACLLDVVREERQNVRKEARVMVVPVGEAGDEEAQDGATPAEERRRSAKWQIHRSK